MKTLAIMAALLCAACASAPKQTMSKRNAKAMVELYTGERYHQGDCETQELWETADSDVFDACEILEGE